MVDKERVGRAILEQRKANGMTQKQMANLLHVSYQAVSRWEQGLSLPSVDMLYDIAKLLETTVDFLLEGLPEERRVIDYLDTGLDTHRLYIAKDRLTRLITPDEALLYACHVDPVFLKPAIMGMEDPVCAFANHVPGSKERFAVENGYDREICANLVSAAANDLIRCGVKPMVLQANMVCGNNDGGQILTMGESFKEACESNGIIFAGMEVSGQAVNYPPSEYQLKAMVMGYADRKNLITGEQVAEGDLLIGLHTDGIFSVSYPFVKVMLNRRPDMMEAKIDEHTLFMDELIKPNACYVSVVCELMEQNLIHGAFVTGRSLFSGVSFRSMPLGLGMAIFPGAIQLSPLYRYIYSLGMMDRECFLENFNLGIGMILAVSKAQFDKAAKVIEKYHKSTIIGKIEKNTEHPDETAWMEGIIEW